MRFRVLLLANVLALLALTSLLTWAQGPGGNVMTPPARTPYLAVDSTDVLGLRDGTNSMIFNVYKTFISASSYQRMALGYNLNGVNTFSVRAQKSGAGGDSPIEIVAGSASNITLGDVNANTLSVLNTGSPSGISLVATAFASLSTPGNGAIVYCSDCKVTTGTAGAPSGYTNNTCTNGGNGALAIRLNSVWACYQ